MTLGDIQRDFTKDVAKLIRFIYSEGYEATLGDAFRDPRSHGAMGEQSPYGRAKSAHKQRLAIDLNLFLDGVYLSDSVAYAPFGEFWESLHPDNRWGGDFSNADGNHFSRKYGGIA
jgi:hypothetical protein